MRRSKDFQRSTRRGVRASRPTLVVHAARIPDDDASNEDALNRNDLGRSGPRIGFVVSGAVGNAVTRNRVKRRLRHLAVAHVAETTAAIGPEKVGPEKVGPAKVGPEKIGQEKIGIVVRALPRAATDPMEVPTDLASAWHDALSRLTARSATETALRNEIRV
jgi:ribonuclease P protein component